MEIPLHKNLLHKWNSLLYKQNRIRRDNERYLAMEKISQQHKIVYDFGYDDYNQINFYVKFSKRADVDLLLIDISNYFRVVDLMELTMNSNCLSGYYENICIQAIPEKDSECQLVVVGEEYHSGWTSKVYKMKCEHEHEQAAIAAGDNL